VKERDEALWQAWEKMEMHRGFWWGNLKEKHHFKRIGVDKGKY